MSDIETSVREVAQKAQAASMKLALTKDDERKRALEAMANALIDGVAEILEANACDMDLAREAKTKESILDRLMLDESRVVSMASALRDLRDLSDPLGQVQMESKMYNGIELKRISTPIGVVAIVFEARPNVCADAAGICIRSGNACILRGGSMASNSNKAIAKILSDAAVSTGLPKNSISAIESTDRKATDVLMSLHGLVDVLIPRGGAGLIQHCVEASKVPVIETGTGNCHVYIEKSADAQMAKDISVNSKCRRYGVCNAAESLLVDEAAADDMLPSIMRAFEEKGVLMHLDEHASEIAAKHRITPSLCVLANESDWETEYLAPEIAIKCVSGVEEAIEHINRYGTNHSEAIVTEDDEAARMFCEAVDASAVYVNAATSFTDGGQFGLGAEIGISTQKLHVRGPFALDGLTSYKYIARGSGQTRE